MLMLILVVLIVLALVGGLGYGDGAYRAPGLGIGGILLAVLLVLLFTGALRT